MTTSAFGLIEVTGTAPAVQLMSAGDGPALLANEDPLFPVYLGPDPTTTADGTRGSPLGAGGFIVMNGKKDVYAIAPPGEIVAIAVFPTGLTAGNNAPIVTTPLLTAVVIQPTPPFGDVAILPATPGVGYVLYQTSIQLAVQNSTNPGSGTATAQVQRTDDSTAILAVSVPWTPSPSSNSGTFSTNFDGTEFPIGVGFEVVPPAEVAGIVFTTTVIFQYRQYS